ncbi:Transmembrane protein 132C [Galemys pyrenaicus]|uniref:Transmembrane protein 132C n=1 Tax=Galemys pyrenaicus TaxID=202257 RepID=A0A8J6DMK0_GALPY|nr:Transmembrane protein 132C [Galemys pyrenaicus]
MSIAEACQKSKRKSVLAVGVGHIGVKFGPSEADASPGGDGGGSDIENHASERRHRGPDPGREGQDPPHGGPSLEREEGALRRPSTTARAAQDKAARAGWPDGGRPPGEGQPQTIPLDFTNFPAQVDLPRAGAGLQENGLVPAPRGLSDLEIGMYALLGVFCLAILVFLANCAAFALRYRHKQLPLEAQASMTHLHDWVWLGNEAELLESVGDGGPPAEHTTVLDRGLGGGEESNQLLLNGGSQRPAPGQNLRAADRQAREQKLEPPHSPTSKRKKVKFTTFTTIPSDDGCPTVNSILGKHDEGVEWACRQPAGGAPAELRNYLEKLKDKV